VQSARLRTEAGTLPRGVTLHNFRKRSILRGTSAARELQTAVEQFAGDGHADRSAPRKHNRVDRKLARMSVAMSMLCDDVVADSPPLPRKDRDDSTTWPSQVVEVGSVLWNRALASLLSAGKTARLSSVRERDGREWLRQAGLRVTTPRRVVLETLADNSHATVAELAKLIRSRRHSIATQTIYGVFAAGV
jgi:hypothetical protein